MNFVEQCVIGTLAAIGFICILKMGYDIIFNSMVCPKGKAVLYIYAPKEDAEVEQLLRQAILARRAYLPGMMIYWVDTEAQMAELSDIENRIKENHAI